MRRTTRVLQVMVRNGFVEVLPPAPRRDGRLLWARDIAAPDGRIEHYTEMEQQREEKMS